MNRTSLVACTVLVLLSMEAVHADGEKGRRPQTAKKVSIPRLLTHPAGLQVGWWASYRYEKTLSDRTTVEVAVRKAVVGKGPDGWRFEFRFRRRGQAEEELWGLTVSTGGEVVRAVKGKPGEKGEPGETSAVRLWGHKPPPRVRKTKHGDVRMLDSGEEVLALGPGLGKIRARWEEWLIQDYITRSWRGLEGGFEGVLLKSDRNRVLTQRQVNPEDVAGRSIPVVRLRYRSTSGGTDVRLTKDPLLAALFPDKTWIKKGAWGLVRKHVVASPRYSYEDFVSGRGEDAKPELVWD